ncbi:MAG: hypothetical protein ACHQHN_04475 [Sphingobacteriales bacterium]
MIIQNELLGTLVLLRPNDIPELQNKIGSICSELIEDNTVVVNLNGDFPISFSVHELFVLRNPEEIEKSANNDYELLPSWNYGDIMEVAILANSPHEQERIGAIELSAKDPDVFEYTMTSLAEELGLNQCYNISR